MKQYLAQELLEGILNIKDILVMYQQRDMNFNNCNKNSTQILTRVY